jgi:hypothetical protein
MATDPYAPPPQVTYGQTTGWFDPTSTYGGQWGTQGVTGTPFGSIYLRDNPNVAYARYTSGFGGLGDDAFSKFVQSQYRNANAGYLSALATNPNLDFYRDYLPGLGGEQFFRERFQGLAPSQRGENQGLWAPRARWITR